MNLEDEAKRFLSEHALKIALPVAVAVLAVWLPLQRGRKDREPVIPPLTAPLPIEFEVAREIMALCIARLYRLDAAKHRRDIERIQKVRGMLRPDDADAIRLAKYIYGIRAAELAGK